MPDWSGGLAHAIAAAGIVTAALSGVAAPDSGTDPSAVEAGTGPSYFSSVEPQDQGPTYVLAQNGPNYFTGAAPQGRA
ncbi:hypothetical protein [Kitasatospora sp. NPDC056531]|uniref:hypothetical protein n=1 Tax=Kitasatospora sp. NPDC056531 TaxID=3345856 RepID=UPI0036C1A9E7